MYYYLSINGSMVSKEQLPALDLALLAANVAMVNNGAGDSYRVEGATPGYYEYDAAFSLIVDTKMTDSQQRDLEQKLDEAWELIQPGYS